MVYIDVASNPEQTLMSLQRVGNVSPMHCTGNGKLLLLNYSETHFITRLWRNPYSKHLWEQVCSFFGKIVPP